MASLDFEKEKAIFRAFYHSQLDRLEGASQSLVSLFSDLCASDDGKTISKIESRVKSCEECIQKFDLKYLQSLEESGSAYSIKDHIHDLVGLRIVCLYEDDIDLIVALLEKHFNVLEMTDKISEMERTESSFGYKGLHLDLMLKAPIALQPEYAPYSALRFEVQIRTIIQDAWSVLDHQIKYKKSIPNHLKRRISTLAALFELADREFRQIRDATAEEIRNVEFDSVTDTNLLDRIDATDSSILRSDAESNISSRATPLNAFSFLKIAGHFFPAYDFEAEKMDAFVQLILTIQPNLTRSELNQSLRTHIGLVKRYQIDFEREPGNRMNPYTVMRHCLYLSGAFPTMLSNTVRKNFENWMRENARPQA